MDDIDVERLLKRRRECLMSVGRRAGQINHRVYQFCDTFSQSTEDIAVAADFFEAKST